MATIRALLSVAIFLPACAAQPQAPMDGPPIERIVQTARADAAQRSGLPAAQLPLVTAESVTWSDGSLGCPKPGMLYTTPANVAGWCCVRRGWRASRGRAAAPESSPMKKARGNRLPRAFAFEAAGAARRSGIDPHDGGRGQAGRAAVHH
jgi:hypothetical protein